jgi:hypothetical protein
MLVVVGLVERLAGLAMIEQSQERTRVRSDQLALAAPSDGPTAGQETAPPLDPVFGNTIRPRLRALVPRVLAVLAIGAVIVLLNWPQ